jgi:hypothetical protein
MPAAYSRELATGLMTMAVALTLVSVPSTYTQPGSTGALGLTVSGSQNISAGMTVAIPVSGTDEQATKPHKHGAVRRKNTGS